MAWLYCLVAVVVAPFVFMRFQITNPFGYMLCFVGLFFVVKVAHHQYADADFLMGLSADTIVDNLMPMVLYLAIAYAVAFIVNRSLLTRSVGPARPATKIPASLDFQPTTAASALGVLLPLLLVWISLAQGINPTENPLAFRQLIQGKGMLYLLSVQIFVLVVHACYVPYVVLTRKEWPSALAMAAFVASLAFSVVSGFASMVLTFVISPVLFYSVCFRRRIEPYIFAGVPIAFVYTLIYSAYRDARLQFGDISLREAFDRVLDSPEILTAVFNRFDYLEMFVRGQQYISDKSPDLGVSLVNFLLQPIPRGIWPDKPDNFSTLFTRALLPENIDIGVTANFNSLNEFMYSFGVLGILIGGVIFGLLLLLAYRSFLRAAFRPYDALFYLSVVFPYVTSGFVAGFVNDLALPLLLLNLIFFRLLVKRRGRLEKGKSRIFRRLEASGPWSRSPKEASIANAT